MSSTTGVVDRPESSLSRNGLRLVISLALGGVATYLSVAGVDLGLLLSAIARADLAWLGAGSAAVLAVEVVKGARWQLLFLPDRVPFRRTFSAILIGRLWNNVVPLRAGDLVRAYLVAEGAGLSKVQALGTVAIEKVFDSVTLVACAAALVAAAALPPWLKYSGLIVSALAVPTLGAVIVASRRGEELFRWSNRIVERLPASSRLGLATRLEMAARSLRALRSVRTVAAIGALSALGWTLGAVANQFVFSALGLPLPATAALMVLVAGYVVGTLPAPPGRLGVFEATVLVSLTPFAIDREVALAYAVLLHAVVLLPASILAAAMMVAGVWRFRKERSTIS